MFFLCVAISVMAVLCVLAALPRPKKPAQTYLELTPYELLQRETFLRALEGNKSARDWTLKYTLGQKEDLDNIMSVCYDKVEDIQYTPPKEIGDAISALVSLGHTRTQAKASVHKLVKEKSFKTSQQIIMEAMKRK